MFWQLSTTSIFPNATQSKDPTTIESIRSIEQDIIKFNSLMVNWNGSVITSFPILNMCGKLLNDLKARTHTAHNSDNMTVDECLNCAKAIQELVGSLSETVSTAVAIKQKADNIYIRPIVLQLMKSLRNAASDFLGVIADKAPLELKDLAKTLTEAVDEPLEAGIQAYS